MNTNWREVPFLRLFFALAAGVVTGFYIQTDLRWVFSGLSVALLWALWSLRSVEYAFDGRWLRGLPMLLLVFGLGYLRMVVNDEAQRTDFYGHLQHAHAKQMLTGIIDEAPRVQKRVSLVLQVNEIADSLGHKHHASGRLMLYLPVSDTSLALQYGDEIAVAAELLPHQVQGNPYAFDYGRYLRLQHVHMVSFAENSDVVRLSADHGNPIVALSIRLRNRFLALLERHLDDPTVFGVGSALLLGHKDALDDDTISAYKDTGSMHILAVSGMHVGLIYLALIWIFNRLGLRQRRWQVWQLSTALVAAWGFALITGMGASVMRAAVMFSFIACGKLMRRHVNMYNVLGASAFMMLLWEPNLLFDVGFQLSYLAVVGLVFFHPKLLKIWVPKNHYIKKLWDLTAVGISAQVATLPLTLYYFHQFPNYFWLSGLLAVPVSSAALISGVVLFIVDFFSSGLATVVGYITYALVWLMNFIILGLQKLPFALIENVWLSWYGLIMFSAAILLLARFMTTLNKQRLWGSLALLMVMFSLTAFRRVGQSGQQTLVIYQMRQGPLIDCFQGRNLTSFQLRSLTEKNIDMSAGQFRISQGVSKVTVCPTDSSLTGEMIYYKNGWLQFGNYRLASVSEPPDTNSEPTPADAVLLHGKPKTDIATIIRQIPTRLVIIDGSCPRYLHDRWLRQCDSLGIPCHDIRRDGAFVCNLSE